MAEETASTLVIDPGGRTLPSGEARPLGHSGATDPYLGVVLKDSYRVERRLGEGGMGAVYLAEHQALRKKVAVKVLGPEFAHQAELKQRFLREARAAAAISDDHVVEIYDFGETPDGSAFIAMEYLEGVDLAVLLQREVRLPWPRARDIALQICQALQAAHDRGIVHRDVKPANCFCLEGDRIKVLDFGIAKVQDPDADIGQALTRAGTIFGTAEYMSPEQARGDPHDHRVDVYALGVIVYQMLAGRTPFVADSFMGLLRQHMYEAPPRPGELAPEAEIPAGAEGVVLKALQKDPALRFASMAEMAAALRAVDAGVVPVVVREVLPAPTTGSMATVFREEARTDRIAGRRAGRRGGLLGAALAGGLALVLALVSRGEAEVVAQVPAGGSPAVEAGAAIVAPAPSQVHTPELARPVRIRIDTDGVVAQVFDQHGAAIGSTADPAGFELPRGELAVRLTLRADDHEAQEVSVTPSADRSLRVVLAPHRPEPGRVGARKPPRPEPAPGASKPAAARPDHKTSPDLISPFGE